MKLTSTQPLRFTALLSPIFLAAVLSACPAQAQRIPGSRARNDSAALYRNGQFVLAPDSVIQTRLVQLALTGPNYTIGGHQIKYAQYNLIRAKRTWLNLLSVSADYNDQTFAKTNPNVGYVYPKYFFGLTIPIGLFFTMGPDIKKERENVAIAQENQEELARTIRAEVLSKYAQYKAYGALVALQNNVVDDEEALRKQVEKKFQDGTLTIEQYNQANKLYGDDLTKKLNLQLQQELLKIDLERLIGINLESVLRLR